MSQPPRHFIDLWKLEGSDLRAILEDAKRRKAARLGWPKGRRDADARGATAYTLAMIVFEKNSTPHPLLLRRGHAASWAAT